MVVSAEKYGTSRMHPELEFLRRLSTWSVGIFLTDMDRELSSAGVRVVCEPKRRISYPGTPFSVNGYFVDTPLNEFGIATGKHEEDWLPIATHEYSHFLQYRDNAPAWSEGRIPGTQFWAINIIGLWLGHGVELAPPRLDEYIRRAREVERDCEERTLALLARYGLPVDPKEYAQKANSYLFFYTAMKETRRWYGKAPYEVREVWRTLPDAVLPAEAYDTLPDGYLRLIKRHCV
jgi:hypothetical protein